jgi:glycosyltransferase involved in cell wall biosynthesis
MKITLIGTLPPLKNISPYCFFLAKSLSKKVNLEFIGFNSPYPNFLYYGGVKEKTTSKYTLKNIPVKNIINWYNPLTWIKAGLIAKGSVIHIQHWAYYTTLIYIFILPILKIRNKKIVMTIHNITPHITNLDTMIADKIFNKITFPFADAFIIHNNRNKKIFVKLFKIKDEKIFIIGHGILKPYCGVTGVSKKDARKKLGLPMNKKIILNFGYMWGYKGIDILLKSMDYIRNKVDEVVLMLVGQPLNNWKNYNKIIEEKKLDNIVIKKLEYIEDSDIEPFFACADLVVLPYKKRPFDTHGGVGALGIIFKKPIVVTNVGGLDEYVKDERAIAKAEDEKDLADKVINIINNNSVLSKLSKDSEELTKVLSWDNISEKTIKVYDFVS